jgi:DNA recombination protein RmuC
MSAESLLVLAVGAAIGLAIGWLLASSRSAAAQAGSDSTIAELRGQLAGSQAEVTTVRAELRKSELDQTEATTRVEELQTRLAEERKLLDEAESRLSDAFTAIASKALEQNNAGFLALATERLGTVKSEARSDLDARKLAIETLVKPLGESLAAMSIQIQALEKARGEAYGALNQQLVSLLATEGQLKSETANLVKALRAPQVRGRWGEVQLKRVVELAGMVERCDFFQQESVDTDAGRLRPDMRIQLPGGRSVIVDAKTPLQAYLDALEAPTDELRTARLIDHARQVRAHMTKLDAKAYWDQFDQAPQFVVMFLPGETFFSAALEQDPSLIEYGQGRVVLATPTTLIALLKAVSYGWMQQDTAENADKIRSLGRDLYDRIATVAEFLDSIGGHLGRSVDAFNRGLASFEARVVPSARRFKELGISSDKEIEVNPIEKLPRRVEPLLTDDSGKPPSSNN